MDVSADPEAQQEVMREFTYITVVWFLLTIAAGVALVFLGLGGF